MATPMLSRLPAALPRVALVTVFEAALLAVGFGGVAPMLRDPRAIALLALWAAGGIALTLGRPARAQDVTESRKDPLLMVALLVIPTFTPMVGALAAHRAWLTLPWANTLSWIGVALVAAGLALRVWAMFVLGARFSPLVAIQREHALETRGPYARVRHPGYLGALLACLGGAIAFGSAAALPLVALMLAAQLARIRAEETLLAQHFGDAWKAYAARSGALLPKL